MKLIFLLIFLSFTLEAESKSLNLKDLESYTAKIVAQYPHDSAYYTEGFFYIRDPEYGEILCESSGLYGKSKIMKLDFKNGKVLQSFRLEPEFFGEGIAFWKDKIVQLSYKSQVGFVYDYNTLKPLTGFRFSTLSGEGWGLTTDGENLIMSDGSDRLYFFQLKLQNQKAEFRLIKKLRVHYKATFFPYLNELEYIKGEIWACLYNPPGYILRINSETGEVIGLINLRNIFPYNEGSYPNGILNGIAWDAVKERLFVTGKWCPWIYEIKLRPLEDNLH